VAPPLIMARRVGKRWNWIWIDVNVNVNVNVEKYSLKITAEKQRLAARDCCHLASKLKNFRQDPTQLC
jgi:hypothetical protein